MTAPAITTILTPNPASGNTTADGTEQTLASASAAGGVFQLDINITNMADGDILELRAYKKVNGSDSETLLKYNSFGPVAPTEKIIEFGPVSTIGDIKFTMKQTAGTNRAYQWGVINFAGS